MRRNKKRKVQAILAAVILAGTFVVPAMSISAECQLLGETSFIHKMLPWQFCESSPAHQEFNLEDESLHVKILKAQGADGEKWDLQVRHRNLNFRANHEYEVSFVAKAKRDGMEICSRIGNIKGDEIYFALEDDKMIDGATFGGSWGTSAKLTTEYQKFSGTFIPKEDIEAAEWSFHYAKGTKFEGNAVEGDEIWFDDMSIVCKTCDNCGGGGDSHYGIVNRDQSSNIDREIYAPNGTNVNYISVNQLGYYPHLSKVAVLGDNSGDIFFGASTIELKEDTYNFDICDEITDEVVYSGKSGSRIKDKDSDDTVYKLDFTEFNKLGRYYIKVGNWRSFAFEINDHIYSDGSHDMLTNALNYFYQNRSGIEIKEKYITSGDKTILANRGGHQKDKASVQKSWKNWYQSKEDATKTNASSEITATGGWYNALDYGKNVCDGGISVWTLQNMYERAS